MIYVLDASAILRFTDREAGFERVRDVLYEAAEGSVTVFLSAVNWGEIVTVLYRKKQRDAEALLDDLAALPITIATVDSAAAADAGKFNWNFNVPYADAFAGSLALGLSKASHKPEPVTLVTADHDFRSVPKGTLKIEFLPGK